MGSSCVARVVISGYYGFGNSGDEAVLQSILLALKEQGELQGVFIEPTVLSVDPPSTERMYKVKAIHRVKLTEIVAEIRRSDALISGGGSLLQDVTGTATIPYYLGIIKLAQWFGKPTYIYSQGIGPVNRPIFYPLIRNVLNRCRYISVRDAESAQLLQAMGVNLPVDVVPDPVMGLPLLTDMNPGKGIVSEEQDTSAFPEARVDPEGLPIAYKLPAIGIAIRFWNNDRSELNHLAEALQLMMSDRGMEIRFLPFHLPADAEASRYVMEQLRPIAGCDLRIVQDAAAPQQMLAEVGRCQLVIGMRLHSLIYAASQYVPLLGISYDPKIDHFLHRLHMKAAASTEAINPKEVAAEALQLLDRREQWLNEKKTIIDELKQQSRQPAQQISAYLRNKG